MTDPLPSPFRPDLFAGQVALVTGGATGIGKHICRVLGDHGAAIGIISRKQEVLDATAADLRSEGIDVWVRSCDVRDAPTVAESVASLVEHYGRLDIVVNNAAGNFPAFLKDTSPNGFKTIVDIDLLGTFNVSRAAYDAWLGEHGGTVVNITAPFANVGAGLQGHVAAAKAGVDSLTRTCAVEWGHHGVRVNAIAPGPIADTEGLDRFENLRSARTGDGPEPRPKNPVGMVGHGTDIAYMLAFLCSPAARFVTGQVIAVDGGGSTDGLKFDLTAWGI